MTLSTGLRKLWRDLNFIWVHPIWSNLIVAAFLATLGYLISELVVPLLGVYGLVALSAVLLIVLLLFMIWRYSRPMPKTVVFVSSGGTCRDPMAKAITTKLFETHKPQFPVVIRAAGLGPISKG